MQHFVTIPRLIALCLVLTLIGGIGYLWYLEKNTQPEWVTDTITRGTVTQSVAVSGVVEATHTAELAFPVGGVVDTIHVQEGDSVTEGQIVMTLVHTELLAEEVDARAALAIAEANRAELIAGPREEERDLSALAVDTARETLIRTESEEAEKVQSAYRTLLSDNLEAFPTESNNGDTPPQITGTYSCTTTGTYTIAFFRSGAQSGHSYRLSGLESGTYPAYAESAAPLGTCGLMMQLDSDAQYGDGIWTVSIPNTRSAQYATNLNAYELAVEHAQNTIKAALDMLEKRAHEEILQNATPRDEARTREDATVLQATARLDRIHARIADRTLRAPFPGIISSIETLRGESVTTLPVVTLVANNAFNITVRIPEIDITRVQVGQEAHAIFDARPEETIPATVTFIAPIATMIDGVAYFEAILTFPYNPPWLRGGLNADVDIITETRDKVLRMPKRFLTRTDDTYTVLIPQGVSTTVHTVGVGFSGNDGYVEITGLNEGDTIVAP